MESMLISNTSDNIVTDAQQEEWRKDENYGKNLTLEDFYRKEFV
jgi:uncharacterized membrane protein